MKNVCECVGQLRGWIKYTKVSFTRRQKESVISYADPAMVMWPNTPPDVGWLCYTNTTTLSAATTNNVKMIITL